MKLKKELEESLLNVPETQLDPSIVEDIKGWKGEPSALDILFILDKIVFFSLSSEFVLGIFQMLLNEAMKEEGTTFEELQKERNWTSPDFKRG